MQIHLSRPAAACTAILIAFLFCAPPAARAQAAADTKVTVGIFSRAFLVQAYYRSAAWKNRAQDLMNARNQAATQNDTAKVDQIDRELANMQKLAQQQLTSGAPLTNIYELLKPAWPAIAKEAKVDVIVESPLYVAPGANVVDVTAIMGRYLNQPQ